MNSRMKAAVITEAELPLVITELLVPEPKEHEVRLKVQASSVNPLDIKISKGQAPHAKHPYPAVLGIDTVGIVEKVGTSVKNLKVGDKVYGLAGGVGGIQGSLAEYQVVDASLLALAPSNISSLESASIPLIFITAWEGLVDRANVSAGKTVLVHGGAGGVGQMVIQIAKSFGAQVYATGYPDDFDSIRDLGATPIDFISTTVEDYVQQHTGGEGFDIVYDTVGGEVLDNSFKSAKTYVGHVVSCLGWGTHSIAPLSFRGATYSGVFTLLPIQTGKHRDHHGYIISMATKLVESGQLRVHQDPRFFKLSEINQAYQYILSGKAKGKVAISISDDNS
ncbi:zinc-dependent alcohol dehydrogenase family protein [Shewanella sp. AS16]|uniref:zinc-dependent alcohol dehydrogenase family protein n=1 Tax=Shewanella sp. AS16 TaxID=2907625 RepID=UPI001F1BE145|nr:zinc-dependent alcohol dehydrogenase family protein [Shewanella sp. AS16]MCE9685636.1 zinc-dependent alcohol dehydrogenase family protein [Shewanella sp. AS16]